MHELWYNRRYLNIVLSLNIMPVGSYKKGSVEEGGCPFGNGYTIVIWKHDSVRVLFEMLK